MKLKRRSKHLAVIPTVSMADIAFLLIIFFMVSTVIRAEKGLSLGLPPAKATERIRLRRNTTNIWIDREGRIMVDDKYLDLTSLGYKIQEKLIENPDLVVLLRADKGAEYRIISLIIEKLKEVRALKLTFATEFEEFKI